MIKPKKVPTLFTVIFEDKSYFIGGTSYFQTKWKEVPHKKIKRIFYRLPDGNHLCLENYDKYYHMIEAITDLNGTDKQKTKLENAYIMGKIGDKVVSYRIILRKDSIGSIIREELPFKSEKIQKLNPNGWIGK